MIPICTECRRSLPVVGHGMHGAVFGPCFCLARKAINVEQYPRSAWNAGEDKGAARDTRLQPCSRQTWCVRTHHAIDEACEVVPRHAMPATDFGPRAATNTRRGKS